MKLVPSRIIPTPQHNLSDEELLLHVQAEFPDLSGALAMLLERYEGLLDNPVWDREQEQGEELFCPQCGSALKLEEK